MFISGDNQSMRILILYLTCVKVSSAACVTSFLYAMSDLKLSYCEPCADKQGAVNKVELNVTESL